MKIYSSFDSGERIGECGSSFGGYVDSGNRSNMRFTGAGIEKAERADREFEPEACELFTSSLFGGGMAEPPAPLSSGDIHTGRPCFSCLFLAIRAWGKP